MRMQTLPVYSQPPIPTIPNPSSQDQGLSSHWGRFQSPGAASCNPRRPYPQWKPNISPCLKPFASSSLFALFSMKSPLSFISSTTLTHSVIKSTIFEDSQACLALATSDPPKLTPRSKSIAVKYHWFREHLEPGVIEIHPIASADQVADIFTKPLSPATFQNLHKQLLGC